MRFDFYLLHPSIVVNGNRIEFVQFVRNVLVQDPEAMILLEDPNDFPEEWPLAEHYREFVRCVDVYALTNPRCFGKIIGESVFSSARRYLQHGKSVCLMAFPYPELRSLCRVLQSSGKNGQNAAAVFFDEAEEVSTIDLVKCDGKLSFFDIKNVSLEYKPLEDVETLKNRADFPQLEPCTKEDTPSSRIYTYQNGTQKMILKSARVDKFPLPKDHQIKVQKLLRLQEWFTGNGIENGPQKETVFNSVLMNAVVFHSEEDLRVCILNAGKAARSFSWCRKILQANDDPEGCLYAETPSEIYRLIELLAQKAASKDGKENLLVLTSDQFLQVRRVRELAKLEHAGGALAGTGPCKSGGQRMQYSLWLGLCRPAACWAFSARDGLRFYRRDRPKRKILPHLANSPTVETDDERMFGLFPGWKGSKSNAKRTRFNVYWTGKTFCVPEIDREYFARSRKGDRCACG